MAQVTPSLVVYMGPHLKEILGSVPSTLFYSNTTVLVNARHLSHWQCSLSSY